MLPRNKSANISNFKLNETSFDFPIFVMSTLYCFRVFEEVDDEPLFGTIFFFLDAEFDPQRYRYAYFIKLQNIFRLVGKYDMRKTRFDHQKGIKGGLFG